MKTTFNIEYLSEWETKNSPAHIEEGCIQDFKNVKWTFLDTLYEVNRYSPDLSRYTYVNQSNLLVLYDNEPRYSPNHPHPNNLVLYNLKKEVVKIIAPPKARKFFMDLPFEAYIRVNNGQGAFIDKLTSGGQIAILYILPRRLERRADKGGDSFCFQKQITQRGQFYNIQRLQH